MKQHYLLIIFILFTVSLNAQIVEIPDEALRYRLINTAVRLTIDGNERGGYVDQNNDGEIQTSEALAVTGINFDNLQGDTWDIITSLEGLENFVNLKSLGFGGQNINSINISLPHLETLSCDFSRITSINLDLFPNLKDSSMRGNLLSAIDITQLSNLELLHCEEMPNLQSINAEGSQSIKNIYCITAPLLSNMNLSGAVNLEMLSCGGNLVTILDLSGLSNLTSLTASDMPNLTTVNLTGCVNLRGLTTTGNRSLTSLELSNFTSLRSIFCYENSLTSLDVSGCTSLERLECGNNQLRDINISGCINLTDLSCFNNLLTTIDATEAPMASISASNNLLVSVLLKNGIISPYVPYSPLVPYLVNNPTLRYICADEGEVSYLREQLLEEFPNIEINSYCTFVPAESYNTITGTVKFDLDGNGCDENDALEMNVPINISSTVDSGRTFTNSSGDYIFYTGTETVTLTPVLNNDYYTITPAFIDHIFEESGETANIDFCLAPNGIHPDLEISILPVIPARPGFNATYQLIVSNKGNQVQTGSLNFHFNEAVLSYITSSKIPSAIGNNILTWNFEDLIPLHSYSIMLTLNVNTPMDTPAVNIADILPFSALITTEAVDETPLDNSTQYNQVVIDSYDPNDKQVVQGAIITENQLNKYLDYIIRFQNTGTAEAINVVVADVLAANLDVNTFRPVSSSHPYRVTLTGNKAEFFFENINLPAEEDDEAGSNGFIAFKIKPVTGAVIGDVFENTAQIYFDYNAPIVTNTVATTAAILARNEFDFNNYIKVYPNPVKDIITIAPTNNLAIRSINIYNMLGQLVIATPSHQTTSNVNVSVLKSGNYILEVVTDKGRSTQKIIKM